jgi:hypothetical protein
MSRSPRDVSDDSAGGCVASQEKGEHGESERTIPSDLFRKAGSESRQELMTREPKAIEKAGRQRHPPPCSGDCVS